MIDSRDRPLLARPSVLVPLFVAAGLLWHLTGTRVLLTPDIMDNLRFVDCLSGFLEDGRIDACYGASHWTPGEPFLLAVLAQLGATPLQTARALNIVAGALLPVPVYLIASTLSGRRAGLWAAGLTVPCGAIRFYALIPDSRLPALLCAFVAFALVARWIVSRRLSLALAAGLFAGTTAVLRPEGDLTLMLVVGAVLLVCASTRSGWRTWLAIPLLGAGAALVFIPMLFLVSRLTGQWTLESREWELGGILLTRVFPMRAILPLFDLGSQDTPMRELLKEATSSGQVEVTRAELARFLLGSLPNTARRLPFFLVSTLSAPLLVTGVVGMWRMLRSEHGLRKLALWSLMLAPLAPLAALPQTLDFPPEGNLLFVPLTLTIAGGAGWAWAGGWTSARLGYTGKVILGLALLGWTTLAWLDYGRRADQVAEVLFDSSRPSRAAAGFLAAASPARAVVYTSYAGLAVAVLANRDRSPWPSAWEIPAFLESRGPWRTRLQLGKDAPEFVVVTSIDAVDNPLAVRDWLEAKPPLPLLFHRADGEVWVVILGLSGAGMDR